MHIQTHVMSGFCVGDLFPISAKERFFCMLAASLPDLDGVTYVLGQNAYWATHHVYGHNLLFALLLSGVLTLFSEHRERCFLIYQAVLTASGLSGLARLRRPLAC